MTDVRRFFLRVLRPLAIVSVVVLGASVWAAALGTITVTSPTSGSTVTVPFVVNFTYSATATYTKLWIDGVAIVAERTGSTFNYTVTSLAVGSHTLALQADDATSNTIVALHVSITVSAAPPPITISVGPTSASLLTNATQAFTATLQNTSNTGVTWAVDGTVGGSSTVGTITGSGTSATYTAPATAGTHTVTATSVANTGASASASVTVTTPPPITVSVSPTSASLLPDGTQVFTATLQNTSNTGVTWTVDQASGGNSTVGTIVGSGASATYTAPATVGSHTITATSVANTGAFASANVTITAAPPISVTVSPTAASLPPEGTQQFTATVQNTSNTGVTWTVNGAIGGNSSVGTIAGTGATVTYTAPATAGNYSVAATSVANTGEFASANVTVTAATGFPTSSHVFVIMEENQSFSQVFPSGVAINCSSSGMPYLCGLAASNGLALNFYANVHGSMLDYLYNTSGATWTASPTSCTGGGCAKNGVITGDNIVRALTAAGKTWRGYFEDMPSEGYMGGNTANYVPRHNPFVWYSDVANSSAQQSNLYPFTQLAKDVTAGTLQNFNYIVPNIIHDADDGASTASALLANADSWLSTNIAPLLTTAPFQPGGDGILIVVFDEGDEGGESDDASSDNSCSPTQSTGCGGHIAFVMIGPNVIQGSTTSNTYHFQDMLHTVLHLLGITDYMNGASGAADIALLPGVGE